ncbi:hypothetical protein O5O51_14420 [Sinirhodobacter sp. HNIBRBA609]|nr:hypothetical protein O5O51_14420 [Sinirhodobacter sp. HNIBRBA609]
MISFTGSPFPLSATFDATQDIHALQKREYASAAQEIAPAETRQNSLKLLLSAQIARIACFLGAKQTES